MSQASERILVLGLGMSGMAAARFELARARSGEDVRVTVVDERTEADDATLVGKAESLRCEGAAVSLGAGEAPEGPWDLVVTSPGIPPHAPVMLSARASGAAVISEVELGWRVAVAPIVAVTGTNGKTTVTALIAHLLTGAGIDARACGNIGGTTVLEAAASAPADSVLVAEVSSFQLALTDRFHPKVAVLLNITPDHLDWHGDLDTYAADKAKVFANMGSGDTVVIDVDDPGSAAQVGSAQAAGATVVRVSLTRLHAGGASVVDGVMAVDRPGGPVALVAPGELRIRGDHNVSNALAAASAALALGAGLEAVRRGLESFEPVEHRLEPVAEVAGVRWVNDSKATNPDAVLKALTAFGETPVIVLLGGRNKHNDFRPLARAVAARVKAAVLFGECLPELREAFRGLPVPVVEAAGLADAVRAAADLAVPGDVVLLSPANASFDEFDSYGHRGREFKRMVSDLAGGSGT
jgi:UDP-N-acetylmuramoylalanine--D-glutamate ligase